MPSAFGPSGSEGIELMSKLSGWLLLVDIALDEDSPREDLEERVAMELANLAVLEVLDGARMVEVAV
jgi:hypothetical protein